MLQTRYFFTDEFQRFLPIFLSYHYDTINFPSGSYLKKPLETFQYNYFITNGFCKVSVIHESGAEKVIGYWGKGSIYPIICTEQKFYLETSIVVTAMTDMEVMRFTSDETCKITLENPEIALEMVDHYCKFTNLLFFYATAQSYDDIKTRACSILYMNYVNTNNSEVYLTQTELSSLIGSKRESVVKILKELRDQEIIKTSKQCIHIQSIDKLIQYGSLLLK